MALDFQQIYTRIRAIGKEAHERSRRLEGLRQHARRLLGEYANRLDMLKDRVERARQHDPNLRCAIPVSELLNASHPDPSSPPLVQILAADGSQVNPDRHAAVQYCLINIGVVAMQPGSGKPPQVFTDSRLLFAEELYTESGMLTEEIVAVQRDIAEREKLLELAQHYPAPIVALTDGPVELWGAKGGAEHEYRRNLQKHLSVLSQLNERNAIVAGYVDKPGADLVLRLLEIAEMPEDELGEVRERHSLRGVSDRWLYGGLLKTGERSSLFAMQSGSRVHYTGALALHFFYLNTGDENHPSIVRVEVPAWVANDIEKIDLLHGILLQQCRCMGARPYPYILHRAHETAVVSRDEKTQVEQMLMLELRRQGSEVEAESHKQSSKGLPGKVRHK